MRHVFICHNSSGRKSGNFLLLLEKDGRVLMSTSFYKRKSCLNKKLSKKMINSSSYTLVGEYKMDLSKFSEYLEILFPTIYGKVHIIQNYEVG